VLSTARALLKDSEPLIAQRGLTLVGITIGGLEHADGVQLVLPLDGHRDDALDSVLDDVRERFGTAAIQRATLVKADRELSAWLLPGDAPADQPGGRPSP